MLALDSSNSPFQTTAATEASRHNKVVPLHPTRSEARAPDPDAQLVEAARAGDHRAYEMLIRKHQSKTIALAARMVGESDAPDVAQETFIKVFRALKSFQGDSLFTTWLHRITVNTAKNFLVTRRRRSGQSEVDIGEAEEIGHARQLQDYATPEAMLASEETRYAIVRTIAKLPNDLRRAITLREMEGLSYEEIAAIMKCPVGTVRSRIFRAREAIDMVLNPAEAVRYARAG